MAADGGICLWGNDLVERLAIDKFHHQIEQCAADVAVVIDKDAVGMVYLGCQLGFALEQLDGIGAIIADGDSTLTAASRSRLVWRAL